MGAALTNGPTPAVRGLTYRILHPVGEIVSPGAVGAPGHRLDERDATSKVLPMPGYVPTQLPEMFRWHDHDAVKVLRCNHTDVLSVAPIGAGRIVEVALADSSGHRPRPLARSQCAGQWWGARWGKQRSRCLINVAG
jgi:hypothetical protein